MTAGRRARWLTALAVAASAGFALLAHASLVNGVSPAVGALLSLLPLAGLAAFGARASRPYIVGALAVATCTLPLGGWSMLERHFPDLFFVEHAGVNLLLAIVFGRTLAPGREPLCTRFARMLHGELPPRVERYTRRVTLAWTLFFAALCAASCAFYFGRFTAAWSLLANIVSPLLIAAMFVVEYAVRLQALPGWERVGVLGGIRAFSRHFANARAQAPR